MMYFYKVHVQENRENEVVFFILGNDEASAEGKIPPLSREQIGKSEAYAAFAAKTKKQTLFADYEIYETEDDIMRVDPIHLAGHLDGLVSGGNASRISTGELEILCGKNVKAGLVPPKKSGTKLKKKKKTSGMTYLLAGGAAAVLALFIGLGVGWRFLGNAAGAQPVMNYQDIEDTDEDGFIMPGQVQINPDAEQITVSIDRSYLAVPKEDIQLKGEVVNGAADITLPAFDNNDYFNHVPGYTWGFTSDPNGKKIEYNGGGTYSFKHNMKLYRVLVKFGGGNGTKDDPYIIDYYDQLALMAADKVRGYFKQTCDIVIPDWFGTTPINTINELKADPQSEHFEYDGGGYSIEALKTPLFGKVSGAVIKNVNLKKSVIEMQNTENRHVGLIVCEAYNYRYTVDGVTYETGETLIQNCSVSASAIFAGMPQLDENGNPINVVEPENPYADGEDYLPSPKQAEYMMGGITGLGGQIENCYVTDVAMLSLGDYYLYIGGISGKPANVKNSGVFFLSAGGNVFYLGGIAGSAMGARVYDAEGRTLPDTYGGDIQGCFARYIQCASETAAGGIVGESSTNAADAIISNCYSYKITFSVGVFADPERTQPIRYGLCGGIVGADGKEGNGHLIVNTVSQGDASVIGGGGGSKTTLDQETVRTAPTHAYHQESILNILNRNTVKPNNPKEIYSGSFIFAEGKNVDDEGGMLPFPAEIEALYDITKTEEEAAS